MDRRTELLKHITKEKEGIEIGPFFNPLVPRRDGFNSISLDVFTRDELRRRAINDPGIDSVKAENIESVDLLGPAQDIERRVNDKFGERKFDYIVSSHNIEHIPDPIRFLQGCRAVLKPDGYLSLAAPDHRCCFDYFLPVSTVADWLEAYFERRSKPSDKQVFMRSFVRAERQTTEGVFASFDVGTDPSEIFPMEGVLKPAYEFWQATSTTPYSGYIDAHCWMFTPNTFKLILLDLQYLSLLPFVSDEVVGPCGNEFYVHLRAADPVVTDFQSLRTALLRAIARESALAHKSNGNANAGELRKIAVVPGVRQFSISLVSSEKAEVFRKYVDRTRAILRQLVRTRG
jgi:SAM-dependent methyltransferase